MKTAVVYDMLIGRGGAERATLVLAKAFEADIWTTTYNPTTTYPEYQALQVISKPLRSLRLQWNGRFLQILQAGLVQTESIRKFQKTNLSSYDLVITVGANTKQVIVGENTGRIHYELGVKSSYQYEWLFKPWTMYMKKLDHDAMGKIVHLACNSENTRKKIQNYYHRDAKVIYPAVNVNMYRTGKTENYFLSVQRISPDKKIETQLEAFRMMPEQKLLIVGNAEKSNYFYFKELKEKAPANVTFLGSLGDEEIVELYSHAKAAIQTHPDEDLGRIPIEAMASGKPCIAVNAGGFKETIVNGKTGILVDIPYVDNLAKAIRLFTNTDYSEKECIARAQLFSEETHLEKMKNLVERMNIR